MTVRTGRLSPTSRSPQRRSLLIASFPHISPQRVLPIGHCDLVSLKAFRGQHGICRPGCRADEFVAGSRANGCAQPRAADDLLSELEPGTFAAIGSVNNPRGIRVAQWNYGARQINGISRRSALVGDYVNFFSRCRQFQNRVGEAFAAHAEQPRSSRNTELRRNLQQAFFSVSLRPAIDSLWRTGMIGFIGNRTLTVKHIIRADEE